MSRGGAQIVYHAVNSEIQNSIAQSEADLVWNQRNQQGADALSSTGQMLGLEITNGQLSVYRAHVARSKQLGITPLSLTQYAALQKKKEAELRKRITEQLFEANSTDPAPR